MGESMVISPSSLCSPSTHLNHYDFNFQKNSNFNINIKRALRMSACNPTDTLPPPPPPHVSPSRVYASGLGPGTKPMGSHTQGPIIR